MSPDLKDVGDFGARQISKTCNPWGPSLKDFEGSGPKLLGQYLNDFADCAARAQETR